MLAAHECLLKSSELLSALKTLKSESSCFTKECEHGQRSFVDLARVLPQLEVTLSLRLGDTDIDDPHHLLNDFDGGLLSSQCCEQKVLPAFNNLVSNDTKDDVLAEILNNHYIMPRESCFYMLMLIPVSTS